MNVENNEHIKRKRKMLLFLPMLVLPFLALAFWALGGGKKDSSVITQEGINGELPGAKIADDKDMDKMAFYDKAEQSQQNKNKLQDSGKAGNVMPSGIDSSLRNSSLVGTMTNPYDYRLNQGDYSGNDNYSGSATENRIRNRLQAIQQQLKNSETDNHTNADDPNGNSKNYQLDKLNGMLQTAGQDEKDPEMNQLQDMMKRIYDIQHPEIVKEELRKQSTQNLGMVYPINVLPEETPVTLLLPLGNDSLQRLNKIYSNGFYGIEDYSSNEAAAEAGIEAIVQDNISVVNGATVKMRLLQDIFINGNLIPKGAFINGIASLSNDRIIIEINSVLHNNSLFSVKLSVYDMDGMEGIYVQGSISRSVARQSGDNEVQSLGIGSLDPSIGAQATAAGIETAKTLLSKKTKLVKVFIKAGHKVLLKDTNKQ